MSTPSSISLLILTLLIQNSAFAYDIVETTLTQNVKSVHCTSPAEHPGHPRTEILIVKEASGLFRIEKAVSVPTDIKMQVLPQRLSCTFASSNLLLFRCESDNRTFIESRLFAEKKMQDNYITTEEALSLNVAESADAEFQKIVFDSTQFCTIRK